MYKFKNKSGDEVSYSREDFYDNDSLFLQIVSNIDNHGSLNMLVTELLQDFYCVEEERDDLLNDLYRIKELVSYHG